MLCALPGYLTGKPRETIRLSLGFPRSFLSSSTMYQSRRILSPGFLSGSRPQKHLSTSGWLNILILSSIELLFHYIILRSIISHSSFTHSCKTAKKIEGLLAWVLQAPRAFTLSRKTEIYGMSESLFQFVTNINRLQWELVLDTRIAFCKSLFRCFLLSSFGIWRGSKNPNVRRRAKGENACTI